MITGLYSALCGFLLLGLSARVIAGRRQLGTALGDGVKTDLTRRIRAQANFSEYASTFLIILYFCEISGLAKWSIHTLGILFFTGRLAHAYGISFAESYAGDAIVQGGRSRQFGMALTLSAVGVASIALLATLITPSVYH